MSSLLGLNDVKKAMRKMGDKTRNNVIAAFSISMQQKEAEAKQNARWQDRTGAARSSITASGPTEEKGNLKWFLSILVFYGVYLELKNEGRYRIIGPTMFGNNNNVLTNLKKALDL